MGNFRVLVSGVPFGCQDARPDGTWLTGAQRDLIQAVSPDIELHHLPAAALNSGRADVPPPHAVLTETSGAKSDWDALPGVLFGEPLSALITPELRFLQSAAAGVEHLVPLLPPGVVLCNASGVHANAIAETVIAVILGRAKLLAQRREDQAARRWRQLPCREVAGDRLCVLGTGHIGREVARLGQALQMKTTGVSRGGAPAPFFDTVVGPGRLTEALQAADVLVVACPLTPQTRGIIGARELKAMPEGALVVNIARGAIIEEAALLEALAGGPLGGAFLDAHGTEPLPADHPLWAMPNVDITPHDSHASQLMGDRHVALFCDNLERALSGRPLRNVVDLARGY